MAVDNSDGSYKGNLYVTWVDRFAPQTGHYPPKYDSVAIRFAVSTDYGDTWVDTTILQEASDNPPDEEDSEGWLCTPIPVVSDSGTLFVSWVHKDYDDGVNRLKCSKSTDGGTTFSQCSTDSITWELKGLDGGVITINAYATIAVDRKDTDIIYVAYCAISSDSCDILFTKSTDSGASWTDPDILIEHTDDYQYHPWLSTSPEGILYMIYGVVSASEECANIYVAVSLDQGNSFLTPSIKVNSIASDPYFSAPSGNDYQGIASIEGKAFPCWTDYRNENEDIYGAVLEVFRSGTIDTNETWSQLVVMTGDITIEDTVTLTIELDTNTTNTTIYAIANSDDQSGGLDTTLCELIIDGLLEATGNDSANVINFISTDVDTFPAGWYGIRLRGDDGDTLAWCEIEDAYIGIRSEASVSDIVNCSFLTNELSGIGSSPGSILKITNSLFEDNGEYGIGLLRPDTVEISSCSFYDNNDYGIYITAGDEAESEIKLKYNLIEEGSDTIGHDYGIYFLLVDNGSDDPTYLEVSDWNEISDCSQAGIYISASILLEDLDSTSVIDSNSVTYNYNGIETSGARDLVFSYNEITDNDNRGIYTSHHYPNFGDTITSTGGYNSIYDNDNYDVYVGIYNPVQKLMAQDNWWGSSSGPNSTKLYGNISFYPWLTTAP